MTNTAHAPLKLFQFPRMFSIPNLSPFCCKIETWLRIVRIPYVIVDTPDPRKGLASLTPSGCARVSFPNSLLRPRGRGAER
jgi:hypothetical protein